MCVYSLVDRNSGNLIEADAATVERVIDIEIAYINWAIEMDGKFENGYLIITCSTN